MNEYFCSCFLTVFFLYKLTGFMRTLSRYVVTTECLSSCSQLKIQILIMSFSLICDGEKKKHSIYIYLLVRLYKVDKLR